jgi:hypothetical protein
MPATLDWHDDVQTLLICRLEGEFGIDTYAVMEGQLPMMVREVDHRVDVIFHLSDGASLPPIGGLIREIDILLNIMPPNLGFFIAVGNGWLLTNPLAVAMASRLKGIVFKANASKIRVASSVENAIAITRNSST